MVVKSEPVHPVSTYPHFVIGHQTNFLLRTELGKYQIAQFNFRWSKNCCAENMPRRLVWLLLQNQDLALFEQFWVLLDLVSFVYERRLLYVDM